MDFDPRDHDLRDRGNVGRPDPRDAFILATVTYPNDQTSTYSYFDEESDHRLQTIHHKYPNASTLSKFDYTYDAVGNILTWRQQADRPPCCGGTDTTQRIS